MNKPKVNLINSTPNPIETMCWARRVMHSPVPDSLAELKYVGKQEKWLGMPMNEYVKNVLLKDGMPTFLEYVNLTFKLENVSRALQQQLTRHRIGFSFSIQSLRCTDVPNFATNYQYHNPMKEIEDRVVYHKMMLEVQESYRTALLNSVPTQDARGLLPMNLYSTITFSCTLRALIGMVNKRLCQKTQGEFREVAKLIIKEIEEKVDPRILKWIGSPCKFGHCMMKGENEEQLRKNLITGKQNTDHVCPTYIKLFKGEDGNETN